MASPFTISLMRVARQLAAGLDEVTITVRANFCEGRWQGTVKRRYADEKEVKKLLCTSCVSRMLTSPPINCVKGDLLVAVVSPAFSEGASIDNAITEIRNQ